MGVVVVAGLVEVLKLDSAETTVLKVDDVVVGANEFASVWTVAMPYGIE